MPPRNERRTILMPNEKPEDLAKREAVARVLGMRADTKSAFTLAVELAAWSGWVRCPACNGERSYDPAANAFSCTLCGGMTMVPPEVAEDGDESPETGAESESATGEED